MLRTRGFQEGASAFADSSLIPQQPTDNPDNLTFLSESSQSIAAPRRDSERKNIDSGLEFRILGPVEVVRGGQPVRIGGAKPLTVLVALLLARGRVLPDSTLSALLWGENPPTTRSAQIYTYVSRIRKQLGRGDIQRRGSGYLFTDRPGQLDSEQFSTLLLTGRRELDGGHYEQAARSLRRALELWRGPALTGTTEFLMDTELPAMDEAYMLAVESRIAADLALGRHFQLVSELTALVGKSPLRERLRAQLMLALFRCDRQADALAVYHVGNRMLAEELGVDPGPTLRDAHQTILTGTGSLAVIL